MKFAFTLLLYPLFVYSEICKEEVNVNISDIIFGLKDDTPSEIIDTYIEASSMCMHDINKNNVHKLKTGNNICMTQSSCRMCGTIMESNNNCKPCCYECRCVGCSWNRGPGTNWLGHERVCDSCCIQEEEPCSSYFSQCYGCNMANEGDKSCRSCCNQCRCEGCGKDEERNGWQKNMYGDYVCDDCCSSRRNLYTNITTTKEINTKEINTKEINTKEIDNTKEQISELSEIYVYYKLSVCMDEVSPLDFAETYYNDHKDMLDDFLNELHYCYENRTQFINTWASLTAERGLDLSLMARDDSRDTSTILFGYTGMEVSEAEVKTYYSSESHKATSHMFFYGALGFVVISISAIITTFVVVLVTNKRKEEKAKLIANIGKSDEV
jgi:hypothetical protein